MLALRLKLIKQKQSLAESLANATNSLVEVQKKVKKSLEQFNENLNKIADNAQATV